MSRHDELKRLAARAVGTACRTQKELADVLGVSHDVVRSWRALRFAPRPDVALRLADELDGQADALRGIARELRGQLGTR